MPDFNSREQRLELKLQWIKYKIEALQEEVESAAIFLTGIRGLLEEAEKHIASAQRNEQALGLHLGAIYQQLEALKKM